MKKIALLLLIFLGLPFLGGAFLLWENTQKLSGNVIWPLNYKNFAFNNAPSEESDATLPQLAPMPDISQFTVAALIAKIPALQEGRVRTAKMNRNIGFSKFMESDRQAEFSDMQNRDTPIAIEIQSGIYDIESLHKAINDESILSRRNGNEYTLRVPLYVDNDATFIMRGNGTDPRLTLKLSSTAGAFLISSGQMFIVDSDIIAWNEEKQSRATFEEDSKFRPFITSWSYSDTYFARSHFYDLGYSASKSYGISFSSLNQVLKEDPLARPPQGWLIDCYFEGMYYGFYSYEAEHVSLLGNIYANNIIYGIDPHDRSKHLLIAHNEAYGTIKKHGIIVSREVNDSWIVNNYAHDNHGSGFMLDRTSVRNLVANNTAFRNGNDGLTLFESGQNLIINNKFIMNGRSGLRVRNSSDVVARNNIYLLNKNNGVQAYAFDIRKTEKERDFEEDPFTQHTSLTLENEIFALNKGSLLKFSDTDLIRMSKIHFDWYEPQMVRGDFNKMSYEIGVALRHKPHYIEIRKTGKGNYLVDTDSDEQEEEPD